ncbi:MAG: hypothetical protein ABIT10_12495 [Alteraurantiacibacter sp.]
MRTLLVTATALALLAGCTAPDGPAGGADETASVPGESSDTRPFSGIAEGEVIHFTGTEPFWGGEIAGTTLQWSTPDNIDGEAIPVTRFAGRGGLSFTGTLQAGPFDLAITPATCSDGMSDRTYPFAVTVLQGDQQLSGCGWTDRQGYTGGE